MTLQDLLIKLECCTAPSRELDKQVAFWCRYKGYSANWDSFREHERKHNFETAFIAHGQWLLEHTPEFTKDLTAGLALIPADLSYVIVGDSPNATMEEGFVIRNTVTLTGPGCKRLRADKIRGLYGNHANPAIAMCIALLTYISFNIPN